VIVEVMLVGSAEKEGGEREARENEEEKKRLHLERSRGRRLKLGESYARRSLVIGNFIYT